MGWILLGGVAYRVSRIDLGASTVYDPFEILGIAVVRSILLKGRPCRMLTSCSGLHGATNQEALQEAQRDLVRQTPYLTTHLIIRS